MGGQHVGCQFVGSSGASGGILIMWDNRVSDMEEVSEGLFSLSISFRNIADSFRWMFVGVYGPSPCLIPIKLNYITFHFSLSYFQPHNFP